MHAIHNQSFRGGPLKLRLAVCLVALFFFGAAESHAQSVPTLEVALSYAHMSVTPTNSGLGNFSMNGATGQVAYNFDKWISGVAEAGYYKTATKNTNTIGLTVSGHEISYLLGPRLTYRHLGRYTPFGQILVGIFHDTPDLFNSTKSQSKLGYSAGGGLDVRLRSYLAIRPVEIDLSRTQFAELGSTRQVQTNFRYSGGVVLRF
jgi:opacity protein-like surface antigen